jgi:FkbM family methyltransferase|tara:strand:+ start:386 stop:1096 length:711 start_codon:yes stop_codon:yes gene_type:complete
MIKYLLNLPSFLIRKFKSKKISYSLTSIDLLINHVFKNKKKGFFIDVGCNHPVYNNNSYLLYKKGWRGINIDLDKKSIELFNLYRKDDCNINSAISSKPEILDLYFYHDKSPINTLNKKSSDYQKVKPKIIKKVNTQTLDTVIINSKLSGKKFDFLSIDVEGHELNVLKGLNLKKYSPSIIVVEYLDLTINKLEVYNFNVQNILNSELYNYMLKNGYNLVNWIHSDLVFAHNKFKI